MSDHRIVCTDEEPVEEPKTHAHIVRVETEEPGSYQPQRKPWTLQEVLDGMDGGETFFTEEGGARAEVEKSTCGHCGHPVIRSHEDATTQNNLDSLPDCS